MKVDQFTVYCIYWVWGVLGVIHHRIRTVQNSKFS